MDDRFGGFDRFTYEHRHDHVDRVSLYGWSTYPEGSVLAGQPRKVYLDSFATVEQLLKIHPDAKPGGKWLDPQVNLSHLPGEDDPVPGGMYPDDI